MNVQRRLVEYWWCIISGILICAHFMWLQHRIICAYYCIHFDILAMLSNQNLSHVATHSKVIAVNNCLPYKHGLLASLKCIGQKNLLFISLLHNHVFPSMGLKKSSDRKWRLSVAYQHLFSISCPTSSRSNDGVSHH